MKLLCLKRNRLRSALRTMASGRRDEPKEIGLDKQEKKKEKKIQDTTGYLKRLAIRLPFITLYMLSFRFELLRGYAPSLPNSFVQSSFLVRSSWLTVGRAAFTALMKSRITSGGSRSFSDSTSTQDISVAPSSPGEHGVSFSAPSTTTYLGKVSIY